jgi:hypothetical protein
MVDAALNAGRRTETRGEEVRSNAGMGIHGQEATDQSGASLEFWNVDFWEALLNGLPDPLSILGLKESAMNASIHPIHETQPIIQRRAQDSFPGIETFFAVVKAPLVSDLLGIGLSTPSIFERSFPADLSFCHAAEDPSLESPEFQP